MMQGARGAATRSMKCSGVDSWAQGAVWGELGVVWGCREQ